MTGPRRSAGAWKEIKLFVSSTFRDMQQDRDALAGVLREAAEAVLARRRFLVPIDLRWGISTAGKAAPDLAVLQICLEYVTSSDCMLVLLGDRYGHVPDDEVLRLALKTSPESLLPPRMSITAAEIFVGALARPQEARAGFLFRNIRNHPGCAHWGGSESTSPDDREQMERLKQEIRRTFRDRCAEYAATWVEEQGLAHLVIPLEEMRTHAGRLTRLLLDEVAPELQKESDTSWEAQARQALDASVAQHMHAVGMRDPDAQPATEAEGLRVHAGALAELESFADAQGSGRRCCLTGESGSGKSVLVSRLLAGLRGRPEVMVLAHRAGVGPRSTNPLDLLRRCAHELRERLGRSREDDGAWDVTRLRGELHALLEETAALKGLQRVLLVIDGLDQMDERHECPDLSWLPADLPAHVRLLVTCLPATARRLPPGIRMLLLRGLNPKDTVAITHALCRRYRKHTDPRVDKAICEHAGEAPHPLGVVLRVERLLLFDERDFVEAAQRQGLADEERIVAQQLHTIANLPQSQGDLSAHLIERASASLGRDFGATWVPGLLRWLAVSRGGLRSRDVRALLRIDGPEHDVAFTWGLLLLRSHLRERQDNGLIELTHPGIRRDLLEHLDLEEKRACNRGIALRLEGLDRSDNLRWDIMRYWLGAEDAEAARRYLGGPLSQDESASAALALADHVVDSEGGGAPLGQVGNMLALACTSTKEEHAVRRLAFDVLPLLTHRARIETRDALLAGCAAALSATIESLPPPLPAQDMMGPREQAEYDLNEIQRQRAEVQRDLGRYGEALALAYAALELAQQLVERRPAEPRGRHAATLSHLLLAGLLASPDGGGQTSAAMDHYGQAFDLAESLRERFPKDGASQLLRVQTCRSLGRFMASRGPEYWAAASGAYREADEVAREKLAEVEDQSSWLALGLRREILTVLLQRSRLLRRHEDFAECGRALAEARRVLSDLRAAHPQSLELLHEEARLLGLEGDACYRLHDMKSARGAWLTAERALQKLLARNPGDQRVRRDLSVIRRKLRA